ncbi:MAG TPA: carbonic anhydrase [Pseudonocardia sp.]|nr:carbonic anhydrase [Pseudonocardia sp.]
MPATVPTTVPTTTNLGQILDRNAAFAATDARHNAPALPFLPRLGLYLLTCIDCRVDPADILGIELGEALVQRNIGGRVTPAVLADIAYASYLVESKAPDGPWFEVAIIHHTDCGSALLADDELRRGYAQRIGVDERSLADTAVLDPAKTVATDVDKVLHSSAIPDSVAVSGHVYDVATGLVRTVVGATLARSRAGRS